MMPLLKDNINTLFKISVKAATKSRESKRATKNCNLLLTDIMKEEMIIDAWY